MYQFKLIRVISSFVHVFCAATAAAALANESHPETILGTEVGAVLHEQLFFSANIGTRARAMASDLAFLLLG